MGVKREVDLRLKSMENSILGKKETKFSVIGLILGLIVIGYVVFVLNFLSNEIGLMGDKSLISQPNFVKFKLQEAKSL